MSPVGERSRSVSLSFGVQILCRHRSLIPCVTLVALPGALDHLSDAANQIALRRHVNTTSFLTNRLPHFNDISRFTEVFHPSHPDQLDWAVEPTDPHATVSDLVE